MKILFLSPWFPTPPVNGSKIRICHLLKALSRRHSVSLVSFIRPGESIDLQGTEAFCEQVRTVPYREFRPHHWRARLAYFSLQPRSVANTYSPEMAQIMRKLAGQADCIIASELVTAAYLRLGISLPSMLDDLELAAGQDAWNNSHGWERWLRWLTWQKSCQYIRQLLPHFRMATVVSELEAAVLRKIAPAYSSIQVLPNGVDTEFNRPGSAAPQTGKLVYSGALTYKANYDAMYYFLSEIFPIIRQQQPDAYLEITGSTQGVDLGGLRIDERVRFTGFMDDIRPVIAGAWMCVVPLRQGSGTRLKILEAMALGTPVVSTTKGAEGLAVTPEEDILIADQPEDFARQVVRLSGDTELRSRLSTNGRRLVEQRFSWKMIGQDFCSMVERMAARA